MDPHAELLPGIFSVSLNKIDFRERYVHRKFINYKKLKNEDRTGLLHSNLDRFRRSASVGKKEWH